jgi:hypothetical protein
MPKIATSAKFIAGFLAAWLTARGLWLVVWWLDLNFNPIQENLTDFH